MRAIIFISSRIGSTLFRDNLLAMLIGAAGVAKGLICCCIEKAKDKLSVKDTCGGKVRKLRNAPVFEANPAWEFLP